jgi:hypothetical protein
MPMTEPVEVRITQEPTDWKTAMLMAQARAIVMGQRFVVRKEDDGWHVNLILETAS